VNDRKIVSLFRISFFLLIIISIGSVIVGTFREYQLHLLTAFLLYIVAVWIFNFLKHKAIYINYLKILTQSDGEIKEGKYAFAAPPEVMFIYNGRECRINGSVDTKLDYLMEYVYPLEKIMEFRLAKIDRRRKRGNVEIEEKYDTKRNIFNELYRVSGDDGYLLDSIIENREMLEMVYEIMEDFSFLYIGKDCQFRLLEDYHIDLTEPEKVFDVFDKMRKLTNFMESRVKKHETYL